MELITLNMRCGTWTDKGVRRRNEDSTEVDRSLDAIADLPVDVAPVLERSLEYRFCDAVRQVPGHVVDEPVTGGVVVYRRRKNRAPGFNQFTTIAVPIGSLVACALFVFSLRRSARFVELEVSVGVVCAVLSSMEARLRSRSRARGVIPLT